MFTGDLPEQHIFTVRPLCSPGKTSAWCQDQSFNDDEDLSHTSYNTDWMKSIDNNKKITHITIPGTHDALARCGIDLAICQAWSLKNQLRAGIRYLDLRVTEDLGIVHGIVKQGITFTEVLNTALDFLNQHKNEAVLMRVKPEGNNKINVQVEVQKVIKDLANVWTKSEVPNMGDARGKVILVQKNDFKLGVPSIGTDRKWDYVVIRKAKKKEKIATHLNEVKEMCAKDGNSDKVVVSYSSGTGTILKFWSTPKEVAKDINPWLNRYLAKLEYGPCFGVIAMDFPGTGLIQTVIKLNDLPVAKDHVTAKK
ncbi:1-phosphatidylinositol phosphodiesterase-like [Engraulis encrasicolus]|uniref:1-phosphatidylinositol phosphodiesterase-like n=1 Tax=Engraulis encrasicolus TaxID=184585 RepID=UPI002FD2588D